MNGSRIWVIAMIVPVALLIITSRLASSISPIQTSTSLMTPCCCSSTFQEAVRTSSEVQNGSSTRIISRFDDSQRQARQQPGDRIAEQQAADGDRRG